MDNWTSSDVTTNGIRMHYHRTGGDRPALVLSHGATDNGLCWTRLARALQTDYDVIMPDARGHGQSDAPVGAYTSADHAADLAGLIAALGLQRPAVGGHSMGAGTTLRLIAEYPDLASCAILEDPGFRTSATPPASGNQPDPREGIRRMVLDAKSSDLETTIARGRQRSPNWADEEWQPWALAKQQVSEQFLAELGAGRVIGQDWREQLAQVRCPVLLVTGDPQLGGIVSEDTAREAQSILAGLRVVHLSGAGHNVRRERFDGFIEAVQAFLAGSYTAAGSASR